MTDITTLRLGSLLLLFLAASTVPFQQTAKDAGIDALELSFGYERYMNQLDVPRNAAAIGEAAGMWVSSYGRCTCPSVDGLYLESEQRAARRHPLPQPKP